MYIWRWRKLHCKYKTSSVILIDIRPQNGELKICVYIVIRGIQEVVWFVRKLLLVSHLLVILISVIPLSYLKFIWRFQHIWHGYKNILETFIDFYILVLVVSINVLLSYFNHLWVVISLPSPWRLQIWRPFLNHFFLGWYILIGISSRQDIFTTLIQEIVWFLLIRHRVKTYCKMLTLLLKTLVRPERRN